MAGNAVSLIVKIVTDASGASKGLNEASSGYDKFAGGVKKLAPAALATIGAITALGIAAVNSASKTEQSMGALDSVFGKNASIVKGWAEGAAQAVGLSKSTYGDLASTIGAQLNNLGLSTNDALKGTKSLISLGADLAATFGGTTADAVSALSAALRGESDPSERYGLSLSQTRVNAELAAKGLTGLTGEALTAAKTQTILELATKQAGGAMGQFSRETDTAAGSSQIAAAEFEDAKSALGEALLPAVTAVTTALAGFAKWIGENTTLIYIIVGVVGGLAAAILILNVAMTISTVVIWAMNTAFLASPITWIVIGIIALIAVFVILWNKCEGFRNFFIGMWAAISGAASAAWAGITSATQSAIAWITSAVRVIQTVVTGVWNAILTAGRTAWSALQAVVGGVVNAILGPVHALAAAFNSVVSAIQSVVGWISKIHIPNLGGLAAIVPHSTAGGYAVASASGALRSPRFGVSTAGYSSSVGGTSITVYGGLDSADTIARRISDILQSRTRRTSGVEISRRSA